MIWFLRLFRAYRDLEARYARLASAAGVHYPPTTNGLADALAVTARAVLPAFVRVEVVHNVTGAPRGTVRIIVQENGNEP